MERCKTCKWWMSSTRLNRRDETAWFRRHERHGYCIRSSTFHREATYPDSTMIALDAVGVSATALTDGDFGCVMHEPREVSNDAAD